MEIMLYTFLSHGSAPMYYVFMLIAGWGRGQSEELCCHHHHTS